MSRVRTSFVACNCALLLTACGTPSAGTPSPADASATPPSVVPATETVAIPTATAQPITTPAPVPSVALTVSRSDAADFFQLLQFDFQLAQNPLGEEEFVGTVTDGLAVVYLIGPDAALSSVTVVIDVPTPPTERQSARTMAYLAAVLTVAAEDWAQGTDWLNEKLNVMGESRSFFDGREAVLLLVPATESMHVEFTIAATQ